MKKRITLTIDGKSISAFAGENLLQVAHDHQIDIPGLCYHKKLTPMGACRLLCYKSCGYAGSYYGLYDSRSGGYGCHGF
ncbi:MAG TPA: 2Fe-2S iron-sulfur cluster-binding protein [Bacteroidales bacterium]|nr:2Fe-2S iron-sulfur cluster-binding protein [Bacteroidales bacterium]